MNTSVGHNPGKNDASYNSWPWPLLFHHQFFNLIMNKSEILSFWYRPVILHIGLEINTIGHNPGKNDASYNSWPWPLLFHSQFFHLIMNKSEILSFCMIHPVILHIGLEINTSVGHNPGKKQCFLNVTWPWPLLFHLQFFHLIMNESEILSDKWNFLLLKLRCCVHTIHDIPISFLASIYIERNSYYKYDAALSICGQLTNKFFSSNWA
jgi:hypothetical protein